MKNIFALFTKNQSFIYKVFLFVVATFLVIYLLPKGGQFKYNFQKGKPWQYENLYAQAQNDKSPSGHYRKPALLGYRAK